MCLVIIFELMNPANYGQEDSKTIKYLNKSNSEQEQDSESLTEKQFEKQLLLARKILQASKGNPRKTEKPLSQNCKIVFIETVDRYNGPVSPPHKNGQNKTTRHKKGKSMDLEELMTNPREEKKMPPGHQTSRQKGKKTHNKEGSINLKERKSISQMKHYPSGLKNCSVSKQIVDVQHHFKKKKSKSINSGELQKLKKAFTNMMNNTPINVNQHKKEAKKSSKTNPVSQNSKKLKAYSKSEELFCESKAKKRHKQKQNGKKDASLNQISYSMPLTSKIVKFLSNNSSMYTSQKELQPLKGRTLVIPTEQSVEQIDQIRQYQRLVLRKSSSQRFRYTKKATPINNLMQEDILSCQESTQNIIQNYIKRFQEDQLQVQIKLNKAIDDVSDIPIENSIQERKHQFNFQFFLGSPEVGELQNMSQCQSVKLEDIQHLESHEIKQQEQELHKLNNLIEQIQKKGTLLQKEQKTAIFDKIKGLLSSSDKTAEIKTIEEKQDKNVSSVEINNSQLKESFKLEENMSQLNLEILDHALRQRQYYLIARKEKQLQKLSEIYENDDLTAQKQKIIKWIGSEIKSVVHTRHQLWKGVNIAKDLLQVKQEQSNSPKKSQMMRCLSEKYLPKGRQQKARQSEEIKGDKARQYNENSEDESQDLQREQQILVGLKEGRVTGLRQDLSKSPKIVNQAVQTQQVQEQQLLTEGKPTSQGSNQFLKAEADIDSDGSSIDEEQQYDRDNILNKPIEFNQLKSETANIPQPGLKLKKIQCQIQYESSFNEEELEALTKQSQKLKEESMKIPIDLSVEDKEDIFQFIFLDLCVEITDQYPLDSTIVRKLFDFIRTMKEQSKKQKGFKTNTNVIKQYLFEFISFLKTKPQLLSEVYSNLDKPMGPTALDILKYMHPYDEDPGEDETNETVFILDIKLFELFENEYLHKVQLEKYYQDEEKEKKRRAFLKNAIHIHNKAIFDALNETLDKQRPYGVWGQPFSWKKIAKFYHNREAPIKNQTMLKSAQKTIQYGAYMCGFMIDKQQCALKNNPNISQAYIAQIRDDRLSRMLANDLDEGEEKMLFIDDEETEILVQIGQVVYQNLVSQVCKELLGFC